MRNGRSAAVPGSKTVSMWPMSRTRGAAGAAVERGDDRVARGGRPGRAGRSTVAPRSARNAADPAPDLVDAGGRVAAAVDVDEALEVGR